MKLLNPITLIKKVYKRGSIYMKILIILVVILLLAIVYNRNKPKIEGFAQKDKFVNKTTPETIYDKFYAPIYDNLILDTKKVSFEVNETIRATKMKPKTAKVLDIGSGNGHHVDALNKSKINTSGLEISQDLVNRSKKLYPSYDFKVGDVMNSMLYEPNSFTHITSYYFTLYYLKDKLAFFKNCYNWLQPKGYLIVHLVNREKFNPIISAGDPLVMVSPQKYAKKRITNSVVKFKDFQYKANFNFNKEKELATFEEKFIDDATGNVRQNTHHFYMTSQKNILGLAKEAGFNLIGKIDLVVIQYEYQYLYVLQKV